MATPRSLRSGGAARRVPLVRRLALVLAAVAAMTLAGPVPTAQAHAFLAGSNPADGQVLAAAPAQLRLQFSESVVLSATRIDIVDGTGRHIAPTSLAVVGQGDAGSTEAPVEIVADLPALDHGTYRVSWETLSSDDLHATSGVLVFGVNEAVTARGLDETSPRPVEAGLRWLILIGLAGALGGALAARLVHPTALPGASYAAMVARRCSAVGAITGAVAAVILLAYQVATSGVSAAQLLQSSYGARWGLREMGLLLLVGSALVRLLTLRTATGRTLLAVGAVLACIGTALLGHSGAGTATNVTRVAAAAAHLGAAMTWAGCVVVIALVLLVRTDGGLPGRAMARVVLRRFGPPAAVCVGVMVVTGVYLSSDVVGSVDAALFTIYGRTLLLKLTLAGVVGVLALVNTLRLRRHGDGSTPRGTVLAEAVAAVGVLALAAVLTSGQPAMEPQLVQSTAVATDTLVDRPVADLQETVTIRPNQPGPNVVFVDVFNTRRPAPAPVREVEVVLTSADGVTGAPLAAEPLANGRWSVNANVGAPGRVTVQVTVHRNGLPDATAAYPWTVGGLPDQTRPAVVSTAPIGSVLRVVALVLLVLLVLLGLGLALRLSRGGSRPGQFFKASRGPTGGAGRTRGALNSDELAPRVHDVASGARAREYETH